jgi:LemA protein
MKKGLVVFLVILGVGLLIGMWVVSVFNGIQGAKLSAEKQWANVEGAYQRRADLIPNLVNTVKGAADFERETLEGVINARSKATQITIDPTNVTPEQMAEYQQAQNGVSSALGRLLAVVESYPDIKANKNFLELQSQLEGTENRINIERNKFNEEVQQYNGKILMFPGRFLNAFFGFAEKAYFKAAEGSENAPKVEF